MDQRRLFLPPAFRAIALREVGDAVAHAKEIAGEAGAGTLVWVRRFDTVELALVLEPDEPLAQARRAVYLAMIAAADALAGLVPPEKPIAFGWPDTILLDGGIVGGVRLAWPEAVAETVAPDWLVVGLVLRLTLAVPAPQLPMPTKGASSPFDLHLSRGTSLEIEGIEELDAATFVESFARHVMLHVDRWQAEGFEGLARDFLARLPAVRGARLGIDGNGDLLTRPLAPIEAEASGTIARQPLVPALTAPQWLDPATGEPWL